jgi:hypothetical protein
MNKEIWKHLIEKYKSDFNESGLTKILETDSLDNSTFFRNIKGQYGKEIRHRIYKEVYDDLKDKYSMRQLAIFFGNIKRRQ